MRHRSIVTLLFAVLATFAVPATARETVPAMTIAAVEACKPGAPCAQVLPVRVVIVSMFEVGKDSGDAPGEFQFWKERRHLDLRIPFPQSYHDLYYNPDSQILGMVTGVGNIRSAAAVMALGLDPRFDLSHAYWLVAGIAGIDPEGASIGSAAWARFLVDGDLGHEIDAREIPKDWAWGYFPRGKKGPNDNTPPHSTGEVYEVNAALRDWAYDLTKDIKLPDDPGIAQARARYTGYPNAQRPPFVLKGDNLAALTFWHGKLMNDWANHWVRYWSEGKGEFVTSAMEETGTYTALDYLDRIGKVDKQRLMVLRAGSNYTMPPPGVSAADNLLSENEGYSGMRASLESLYTVGSKVVDELEAHWATYRDKVPG